MNRRQRRRAARVAAAQRQFNNTSRALGNRDLILRRNALRGARLANAGSGNVRLGRLMQAEALRGIGGLSALNNRESFLRRTAASTRQGRSGGS